MTRLLLVLLGLLLAPLASAQPLLSPITRTLDAGWQVRLLPGDASAKAHKRAARWLPATIPGSVQTDLMAARLLADPWVGEGERAAQWVGLSDWQYRSVFTVDAAMLARHDVDLVFDGLDTFAAVRVNGTQVLAADNMFRTWRVAAKALLKPGANVIEIDFASPIKKLLPMALALKNQLPGAYDSAFGDEPKGVQTANYVRKPGYHFGWDFTPRIVTLGISKPVRIEAYDGVRLSGFHMQQVHLDDDVAVLDAKVEITAAAPRDVEVRVDITAPDGAVQTLTRTVTLFAGTNPIVLPARIEKPRRWWPVGYGAPDLYAVKATVTAQGETLGQAAHDIGLRTVEMRREKDQWGRGMAFVVNGVPIFAKGANFEPADSIPSRVPAARTDAALEAAVAANMNMLRIWGGGYYPDDALFDKADRLGLMLWQDFMFGNAVPPNDPVLHESTRAEAIDQVRRLRNHPSLVMWNGNNEVQVGWERWGDRKAFQKALGADGQELFGASIRRLFDKDLRAIVKEHAPGALYWGGSPTSDYDGPSDKLNDGDMHYWQTWSGAPLDDYLTVVPRFMSEFGLQSMPGLRTTREFLGKRRPEDLPVQIVGSAYDSGKGNGRILKYLHDDYGDPKSFVDYIYLSQLFQAEGLELSVIRQRASRPQSMGTLYWTLNDTWPGLINSIWAGQAWGSIDFHNRWKASHYRARRFYAPVTIGAQHIKGETIVTLISDQRAAFGAQWRLRVLDRDGALLSERGGDVTAAPLAATPLAKIADADLLGTADPKRSVAVAELIVDGKTVARQFSYFVHARELTLSDPGLAATIAAAPGGGYTLTVSTKTLARGVWIDFGTLDAALSDNAFDLAAGDSVTIAVTSKASLAQLRRSLTVRSFYGATK
ncbi:beta-mannosidase [Sphingomonas sp. Leaf357]|uniref:beta-mannosidase n=1 Tax=Sphingomonas sp. Leaf357 TaxID=1736350 RepID=UPI0006FC90E1|nr:glycoside hydrolase family 2 protein [Sphingomonas sp. Leaf357]KQS04708.1 beta-mannosidase [Sphingomonas sp. Leaf357]